MRFLRTPPSSQLVWLGFSREWEGARLTAAALPVPLRTRPPPLTRVVATRERKLPSGSSVESFGGLESLDDPVRGRGTDFPWPLGAPRVRSLNDGVAFHVLDQFENMPRVATRSVELPDDFALGRDSRRFATTYG